MSIPVQLPKLQTRHFLIDSMLGSFFFFQAEDGIRDYKVTGVQTCALPICPGLRPSSTATPKKASRVSKVGIASLFSIHRMFQRGLGQACAVTIQPSSGSRSCGSP